MPESESARDSRGPVGSEILNPLGSIEFTPLIGGTSPKQTLLRWEREGRVRLSVAFHERVLEVSSPENLSEPLMFEPFELTTQASEAQYTKWLPSQRQFLTTGHLVEILKRLWEPDQYLAWQRLLFHFGMDVVSVKRNGRMFEIETFRRDEKRWNKGTVVLCRLNPA